MKRIIKNLTLVSSGMLVMLAGCKKEGQVATSNGGKAGTLTASSTTLVLDKTKLADTSKVINFSFTQPNYGYSAAVTNTLQIDAASDNFVKPTSIAMSGKSTTTGYSTADFNALLLKLNLAGGVTAQVQARIVHSISANVAPIYSNVVNITVTPYNLTSWIYVVGAFQGWNQNSPDSLFSATSNGIYTGIINFTDGNNQFLILPKKSYDNKYATTSNAITTGTSVTYPTEYVSGGGNNFYAPATAGNYLLTLNINSNTLTITQVNAYSAIGSTTPGGDYSTDDDLKFINSTDQDWEAVLPFTAGAFKIRQNHDWTWSWGTIGTPDGVSLTDASGGNIPVATAGNYKVTFSIPTTSIITTPPPMSATYTLTKQ